MEVLRPQTRDGGPEYFDRADRRLYLCRRHFCHDQVDH